MVERKFIIDKYRWSIVDRFLHVVVYYIRATSGFVVWNHSSTMAEDLDQFQQLLNTLLSTDNDVRTQAEVSKSSQNFLTSISRYLSRKTTIYFR